MNRCGFHGVPRILAAIAAAVLLMGCPAPPKPGPPSGVAETALVRLAPSDYPGFADDLDYEGLELGISQSLAYLSAIPAGREFAFGADRYSAGHIAHGLRLFQNVIRLRPSSRDLNQYIRARMLVYHAAGRDARGEVLFTGYYEPELRGRRTITPEYRYPVYGRPDDLLSVDLGLFGEKYKGERLAGRVQNGALVPYHDRREIDAEGALYDKSRPIAWVDDPVALYFLHVQGSGRIILEDGQAFAIGYDGSNGRPYRSIGQLLIEEGKISREEMSMQRIRAYLDANPAEIGRVLQHNPSYVFFKPTPEGPLGSLNVKLTPGRSLALDRKLFPPAALAFVSTRKPLSDAAGRITSWDDCQRFMLNQDTGGAIQGPGRADLFWGSGPYAALAAGHLKHPGRLYVLVLKPEAAAP